MKTRSRRNHTPALNPTKIDHVLNLELGGHQRRKAGVSDHGSRSPPMGYLVGLS
jgi:hypothetical protein